MNPKHATQTAPPTHAPAAPRASSLEAIDPRIAHWIAAENERQKQKLILIASESICPAPVREAVASTLANLYAEGYPSSRMSVWERDSLGWDARHLSYYRRYGDRRYYKGCEYVNFIEAEAIRRVAELFATESVAAHQIFANVQPLSGAAANNAVYEALVPPQSTVLGMNLSCGGHLTHGSPVNRSGKHHRIVSYGVGLEDGRIDFAGLKQVALREKPRLIIAGFSAYPWTIDWAAFREVADACGAYLLADIAHPAGLVAAGEFPSPIGHAHVVSFTTHKTLCGPRGAALLTTDAEIARKLDFAVFPGEQGGPHIQAIAGKAVAFQLAASDEFKSLQRRVRENAAALAHTLAEEGQTLAYGGTDTHLCLIDLRRFQTETGDTIGADIAARVLDLVGITCNKNAIAGDTRAAHPSGLRFGTTWVSQRGLGPDDMVTLGQVIGRTLGAMKAFHVIGAGGSLGRVRLPASVLRESQARVRQLIERRDPGSTRGVFSYPHHDPEGAAGGARPQLSSLPPARAQRAFGRGEVAAAYGEPQAEQRALETGAALVDTSHVPVLSLVGERAGVMLQLTLSGDLLRLQPGQSKVCRALDPDATLLGEFRVIRLADEPEEMNRYLLVGDADGGLDVLQWLRDLSDGMVGFDEDLTRKVDGPVVIEDLGKQMDPAGRRVVLTFAGPERDTALAAAGLPVKWKPGDVRCLDDGTVVCCHALPRGAEVVEAIGSLEAADAWISGAARAATLVGEAAYEAFRQAQGAPPRGQKPPADASDGAKPYFIGQAALLAGAAPGPAGAAFVAPPASSAELRQTPLHAWHKAHTKKWNLVPFAGWEMPVMYTGIVEEHAAVRTTAGLFDVAHMGVLEVRGEGAARFLDLVTTNYNLRLRDGDGQYAYALAADGHVLDDLLVYRRSHGRFLVVVNASNAEKVIAFWKGVAEHRFLIDVDRPDVRADVDVEVIDLKSPAAGAEQRVDLALQGPLSLVTLQELCALPADREVLRTLRKFQLVQVNLAGHDILVARTGYTGEEIGFELYVHPDRAVALWEAILDKGAARGVKPAGLGARDSTRTEAGFPLYGHELAGEFEIIPQGAGYTSFVKWHKPFFIGREPLWKRDQARTQRIYRARVTDPSARPVRQGDTVVDAKGKFVGRVTSAAYAGGEQILLLYGTRNALQRGGRIGIFPLPRNHQALGIEPAKDALQPGDSVLLPIAGEVIPRFFSATEKGRRSYTR